MTRSPAVSGDFVVDLDVGPGKADPGSCGRKTASLSCGPRSREIFPVGVNPQEREE